MDKENAEKLRVLTLGDLLDGDFPRWHEKHETKYCKYVKENNVIHIAAYESGPYEVDLDKCTSSDGTLFEICQVASKLWATPEIVGELVLMMNSILRPKKNIIRRK